MQRRQDIFIAGTNEISGEEWVMSMGHLMGLFDQDFLGFAIPGKWPASVMRSSAV